MPAANDELRALAQILADWVEPAPGVPGVYLFGSRVRGDHRPDSDVDIRLFLDEWRVCNRTREWWDKENETEFATLKARLPGPLEIHREGADAPDDDIRKGRENPVLVVGRAVCVWTPPKMLSPLAVLPNRGAVVGLDAGYSKRKATTGLCVLSWDDCTVTWDCRNARTNEDDRRQKLSDIAPDDRTVIAAAVDGPLVPGLRNHSKYRACEAVLSRGVLQKRGKPGGTNSGSGPELHQEATRLALFALAELKLADSRHAVAIHSKAIVEAFPNLFLGTLCDEALFPCRPSKKRKWTDTLFIDPGIQSRVKLLLTSLLPQRTVRGSWNLTNHEEIAGLTCALTALCVAAGQFSAVGAPDDGYIILPPRCTLGRGWVQTLMQNCTACQRDFPKARIVW